MAAAVDTDQSSLVFHQCHSDAINSHIQFPQVWYARNASLFILTLYGEPGACRREKGIIIIKLYNPLNLQISKLISGIFSEIQINSKLIASVVVDFVLPCIGHCLPVLFLQVRARV